MSTLAATGRLSRPALSQGAAARTLRFIPQANLANFDPVWGTQLVVRNAAAMVWDTLYGVNDRLEPQRQMIEAEEQTDGGKTWTFRLREGLRFHDGEPVLSRDVVASLNRWTVRDSSMGQTMRALQEELVAVDDRTFRWRLKRPFPRLKIALGNNNVPMAFIMPERLARTDPFQQITEYVGSGPMRFARDEWVPGARAVFTRFDRYVPRAEPASWLAGGKRMLLDRVEWVIVPDPATASAALQNGEVDWWETPLTDLVPMLRRNRNIVVDIADPLGNVGGFIFNHLHPPFSDVRARRAIAMALNQQDYMQAVVGSDTSLWQVLPGFFTPGTPLYTEAGGEILKGPRDAAGARRLLKEAGYDGRPITVLVAQDLAPMKAMGEVTDALLRSLGMNVDFVATDWGTVGARRAVKSPPGQGGWNVFHSWFPGVQGINPASYLPLRANGERAWFGWPTSSEVEAARDKWFEAPDFEAEKVAVDEMNAAALSHVTFLPTGFYKTFQAWRSNVSGVTAGPLPYFWGVAKS